MSTKEKVIALVALLIFAAVVWLATWSIWPQPAVYRIQTDGSRYRVEMKNTRFPRWLVWSQPYDTWEAAEERIERDRAEDRRRAEKKAMEAAAEWRVLTPEN